MEASQEQQAASSGSPAGPAAAGELPAVLFASALQRNNGAAPMLAADAGSFAAPPWMCVGLPAVQLHVGIVPDTGF
eukprot:4874318-Pyramimonas_sp.AAC.1